MLTNYKLRFATNACSLIAALVVASTATTSHAAIITTPGLTGVRFYEATGPISAYNFAPNSSQMTTALGLGGLTPINNDFAPIPNEYYDVFYSNANGTFNLNGNFVTVEAVYTNLNGGGGLNIAAVDLLLPSGNLRADVLTSWVGSGPNYLPGSEVFAADPDPIPSTFTTMGSVNAAFPLHLRVTVTWSALVPEPTSAVIALSGLASIAFRRRCGR